MQLGVVKGTLPRETTGNGVFLTLVCRVVCQKSVGLLSLTEKAIKSFYLPNMAYNLLILLNILQ